MRNSKFAALALASCLISYYCEAQENCETISLGSLFETLRAIDVKSTVTLRYKKYPAFSYKDFKATEGNIADGDFYEVGYSGKNEIKEIINYRTVEDRAFRQKFIVFDFPDFRILLYKVAGSNGPYYFTPTAFLLMKKPGNPYRNFMINVVPLFGEARYWPHFNYEEFPLDNLEDLSVIMFLDDDLYPQHFLKFFNGQIVYESEIKYKSGTRIVDHESASIFLTAASKPGLQIGRHTCVSKIITLNREEPDLLFSLYPERAYRDMPLWIFYGAHEYGLK